MHKRAPNPTEILEAHKIIMGRASYSIQDITNRAERLGLGVDNSQQQSEIEKNDLNYNTNES